MRSQLVIDNELARSAGSRRLNAGNTVADDGTKSNGSAPTLLTPIRAETPWMLSHAITEEQIKDQDQQKKAANTAAHSGSTVVKSAPAAEKKQNYQHYKNCAHASQVPFL